jgi:integrase/recombinase XerC
MNDNEIFNPNSSLARPEDYRAWGDVFSTWLKNYKSENTRKKYGEIVREFFQWVNKWFTEVTPMDVIDWRDFLERQRELPRQGKDGNIFYSKAILSDASINLYLSALSSFFNSGIENGLLKTNPVDGVKRHSVSPYGRATYLSVERGEDLKLLGGIDSSTEKGLRDKAMILIMLTTAVRVSAIADAVVDDIANINGQWYLTYRNKGGEKQTALLTAPVIKATRAYLDARGPVKSTDPLFATLVGNSKNPKKEAGLKLGATAITNMVARRAKTVGLHHITAHSLRHSAAVQAIKFGSVGDVQKLLKHRSNRVTLIYLDHIEDSKADEMTEKLASRYE